jgi:hypothetical protein
MKPAPATQTSPADRWLALSLLLYSLCLYGWIAANIQNVTMEDGYYYYKIAQNLANGLGPTFDGLHLTNGYHPLWLVCLALVFSIVHHSDMALNTGIALQAGFMAAAVVLVYFTSRLLCGRLAAVLASLLWVMLTFRLALGGLEFSLHALTICAVAYVYLRWFGKSPPARIGPYIALGLLVSLTILARLDTALLAIILMGQLARMEIKRPFGDGSVLRLAAFALPVLFTGITYLAANLLLFGHLLPVSGAIKQDWSRMLLQQDTVYRRYGWLPAKLYQIMLVLPAFIANSAVRPLVLGGFGATGLWLSGSLVRRPGLFRDWHRQTLAPLGVFFVYGIVNYLGYSFLYHGPLAITPWYYVIQPWLAALTVGALVELLLHWRDRTMATAPGSQSAKFTRQASMGLIGVSLALTLLVTVIPVYRWGMREENNPRLLLLVTASHWAKNNLPPDAVIGTWNAGTIGYLSERRVVNLDGVVNDWDYYQDGRKDLCRYWDENNIQYLLDVFRGDRVLASVPMDEAYAGCVDRMQLIWEDDRYSSDWSLKAYSLLP